MNEQNVINYGNNNISNQFNGNIDLHSLEINDLAQEDQLARQVIRSERAHRFRIGSLLALLSLTALLLFVFLIVHDELDKSDLIKAISGGITESLIPHIIALIFSLVFGTASFGQFKQKSRTETSNTARLGVIQDIVLSKGYSRKDWRAAKRRARRD